MAKSASLLMVAVLSVSLTGLLASSPSAVAGGNCQTKLVGKSFACDINNSNGTPTTDCFEFSTEGLSQHFDFFNTANNFGCTCATTGSFKSPKFDSSPDSFQCVDGSGNQISGKIKGKKISGQGTNDDGSSLIYNCTLMTSGTCG
jgi:hypothetical protein